MNKTIFAAALAVAVLGMNASAQGYERPILDQDVFKDSVTITSIVVGQSFVNVSSAPIAGSWSIEVQNLSGEQVCCAFDSAAVTTVHSAKACVRIDTAPTASASGFVNWKRWKRWAQNLSLYCRSLKVAGTAELIITQGR